MFKSQRGGGFRGGAGKGPRKPGGKPPFRRGAGRGGFGDRPETFPAVCSKCGNDCQVPFRPTGERPIFCRDCFRKDGDAGGFSDGRGGERRSYGGKRPFGEAGGRSEAPSGDRYGAQLRSIESKLDSILEILSSLELDAEDEEE